MIKGRLSFDEALNEYRKIVKDTSKARTQEEISMLERDGRRALYEVQCESGYLGKELKEAVAVARERVRTNLEQIADAPISEKTEKEEKQKRRTSRKQKKADDGAK